MSAWTFVQRSVGSGNPFAAPFPGVITSWTTEAEANATMKLKIYRSTMTTDSFLVIGESARQALPSSPARIPVQTGDMLGLHGVGLTNNCDLTTADAGDTRSRKGDVANPGIGTTVAMDPAVANRRINVAAVLEPDADSDGFGDETQDQCPTNVYTQGTCPPPLLALTPATATPATANAQQCAALRAKLKNAKSKAKKRKIRGQLRKLGC
jgi:hypothetical protein